MQPASHNVAVLRQGLALAERLDERQFSFRTDLCPGGTVGAHLRHCLDFYLCLLGGIESGAVDYDRRERDPDAETTPTVAAALIRRIISDLEALDANDPDRSLEVRGDGSGPSRSTVTRELQFLQSHTIHHYALIGFMLRQQGVDPDPAFGVAPSTLRHWEETRTHGP